MLSAREIQEIRTTIDKLKAKKERLKGALESAEKEMKKYAPTYEDAKKLLLKKAKEREKAEESLVAILGKIEGILQGIEE